MSKVTANRRALIGSILNSYNKSVINSFHVNSDDKKLKFCDIIVV